MKRRTTTQDITWFLDLDRHKKLDLNPPYQRRSVWTRKDKQFFLDTIFRGFPSPPIYLHKSVSDDGEVTYHVVDGKQRLETILSFSRGELRLSKDYGDVRLDGKKWSDLQGEMELKQAFWNYSIPVEMLDTVEDSIVNEVFDRLNRNSRKLTRQELRHAKFDGWFIAVVESESTKVEWRDLGVVTTARAKRMADSQAISELLLVIIEQRILGFDQDALDRYYAEYDEPEEDRPDFSETAFTKKLEATKRYIAQMEGAGGVVTRFGGALANFYTLWALVVLERKALPAAVKAASMYQAFMEKVELIGQQPDLEAFVKSAEARHLQGQLQYWSNVRGANTDLKQREARLTALLAAMQV